MIFRCTLFFLLVSLPAVASACSIYIPWRQYMNVVELHGPRIAGLSWVRIHNILDYEGGGRVVVSRIRDGRRIPVAKWENGEECAFDDAAVPRCEPNRHGAGIRLESYFGDWQPTSNNKADLKRLYLRLSIETPDGRTVEMTLSSRPRRNTRKLQSELHERMSAEICAAMDAAS
jgi:hypothetical protein